MGRTWQGSMVQFPQGYANSARRGQSPDQTPDQTPDLVRCQTPDLVPDLVPP